MKKAANKSTTSASGYKAGGGSQARSAKSSKTKGMSPAQIAMLAASTVPIGRVAGVAAKTAGKIVAGRVSAKKAVEKRVKENIEDRARHFGSDWVKHPGAASSKSNSRLAKGKWSSDKQIAKYQRQEAKAELKSEAKSKAKAKTKTKKK